MTAAHVGQLRRARRTRRSRDASTWRGFVARDFPERWSGTGGEESLADYLARERRHGPPRARHPRARAPDPHRGRDAGRHLDRDRRRGGAARAGPPVAVHARQRPRALGVAARDGRVPGGARGASEFRVAAIDYGMKRNIVRLLNAAGCRVTGLSRRRRRPSAILAADPDGIFLSNGPGDPSALAGPIRTIEKLVPSGPSSASAWATSSSASPSAPAPSS